jgi:hypothetical protein
LKGLPNFRFKLVKELEHSVEIEQLVETTSWIKEQLSKNTKNA